jgi:hypothetical protein
VAAAAAAELPEILLLEIDGEVLLSEWSHAAWAAVREQIYSEKIRQRLSPRLTRAGLFLSAANALPLPNRAELNRRLDQLSALLEGKGGNPKELSFKPLAGKPVDGATLEFYAWSDQDAHRCFGHFDRQSGQFVVDRLSEHL